MIEVNAKAKIILVLFFLIFSFFLPNSFLVSFKFSRMEKKNLLSKTWRRCKSFLRTREESQTSNSTTLARSKTWNCNENTSSKGNQIAPEGCFNVYVGPQKQRFVVKTKYANHPLFKLLLEDAEMEYGYTSEGPIMLPCDVELFYKVLAEIGSKDERVAPSCGLAYGSCSPFRRLGHGGEMGKRYGSYEFLTPPRLLKMNHF